MASIRKEFDVATPPDTVWAAFKDVGAVHTRFARGFVTDCRMVADLLPYRAAGPIGAMMEQGVAAMRKTLGRPSAAA